MRNPRRHISLQEEARSPALLPSVQAVDAVWQRSAPLQALYPAAVPAIEEILLSPEEPSVESLDAPTATSVLEDSCNLLVKGKDKVVRNWDAAMGSPTEELPYRCAGLVVT